MIEYVKGELVDVTPAFAVIEANGVGYGLNISLNTYSAIQGKASSPQTSGQIPSDRGACVRLWVYEAIREDAYVLFGFATKKEREMFLLLITVSGVGANTARMILSELSVAERRMGCGRHFCSQPPTTSLQHPSARRGSWRAHDAWLCSGTLIEGCCGHTERATRPAC